MPKFSGLYSKDPNTTSVFDETKRYIGSLAQKPKPGDRARPLVDVDWNATQLAILWALRRAVQWNCRSGATDYNVGLIRANNLTNDFLVYGAGSQVEEMAHYSVGGIPAVFPFTTYAQFTTANIAEGKWLHRKFTSITTTTITDTAANWPTNALVGRTVSVYNNNGTSLQGPFTIASNTATVITISGGSFSLGTGATQIDDSLSGDGRAYFIHPTTPSTTRTDWVWLDCYIDEVAAATESGDLNADPNLNHNIQGTTLESMRRLQVVQSLFVEQPLDGGTADGTRFVGSAGGLTKVDTADELYKYTDASGIVHYCVVIAKISRYINADPVIRQAMVYDNRVIAGRQVARDVKEVLDTAFDQCILTSNGLAPTRTSASQLDIAAGTVIHNGNRVVINAASFTKDTNEVAWAASTTYFVYVENSTLKVRPIADFPSNVVKICMFVTDSLAQLPQFTEGTSFRDYRVFLRDVAATLGLDSSGKIRAPLSFQARGDQSLWYYTNFYKKDGTLAGQISADDSTSTMFYSATGPGATKAKLSVSSSEYVELDSVAKTCTISSGVSCTINPTTKIIGTTSVNTLIAPGFKFGNATNGQSPLNDKTIWIPAAKGWARHDPDGEGDHIEYIWDGVNIYPTATVVALVTSGGNTTVQASTKTIEVSTTIPRFMLPLYLPKGIALKSTKVKLWGAITSGSVTIRAQAYDRSTFGSSENPFAVWSASSPFVIDSTKQGAQELSITLPAVPYINNHPSLMIGVLVDSVTAAVGYFRIIGVEVVANLTGVGDYSSSTDYAYIIPDMV